MEIQVRDNPSFTVVRALMGAGEALSAESGAMMATSGGITVESKMQGGLLGGLKRSLLGGESLFLSTFTAPADAGWVDCASRLPGDACVVELDGAYNLTRGSFLCCESTVTIDTKWGGFKNLAGGEGGFLVHATGRGKLVAACYGAVERWTLTEGQRVVLDSGHLVGFSEGIAFQTRTVARGLLHSITSGEGLVFEFSGPGEIAVQTRNPAEFIGWLTSVLPFQRNTGRN